MNAAGYREAVYSGTVGAVNSKCVTWTFFFEKHSLRQSSIIFIRKHNLEHDFEHHLDICYFY